MMSSPKSLHLTCAMEEIKRLRAMLPHTADGELIEVGEYYYCPKRDGVVEAQVTTIKFQIEYDYWWCEIRRRGHPPGYDLLIPAHDLYSAEPLARAARKEEQ